MKTLAIIPARAGSKRLVNKNILSLLGKPLLAWTIEFAIRSELFDRVVLSTDSREYASLGEAYGISSTTLRADYLSHDTASSVDVALFELEKAEAAFGDFDAVALLQPTSPWRKIERWHLAFEYLMGGHCEAVIGVKPADMPPQHAFEINSDAELTALFPDRLTTRTQDLPRSVYVNGALYLIKSDCLREKRSFFPSSTKAIICDTESENIDIDTQGDFELAEFILSKYLDS